jgi:hypothetical protein
MSQEPTEHIKSHATYRALDLLENQFTLLTIYLVEIARVELRKKNNIFNVARHFFGHETIKCPKKCT